jgi:hypothetical protein
MPGLIPQYIETLRRELAFDAGLATRVCEEIEAHLYDAADAEPVGPRETREGSAIARMGEPKVLATGFAKALLANRVKSVWRDVALAAFAIFIAMRIRCGLLHVEAAGIFDPITIAVFVDRCAFFAALISGFVGFLRWRSAAVDVAPRDNLGLLSISATALAMSTVAGLCVIALTLIAAGWSMVAIAPLLAAVCEVAVLAYVFAHLARLRRMAAIR